MPVAIWRRPFSLKGNENPCGVINGVDKLYHLAGMGGKTGSEYVNIVRKMQKLQVCKTCRPS